MADPAPSTSCSVHVPSGEFNGLELDVARLVVHRPAIVCPGIGTHLTFYMRAITMHPDDAIAINWRITAICNRNKDIEICMAGGKLPGFPQWKSVNVRGGGLVAVGGATRGAIVGTSVGVAVGGSGVAVGDWVGMGVGVSVGRGVGVSVGVSVGGAIVGVEDGVKVGIGVDVAMLGTVGTAARSWPESYSLCGESCHGNNTHKHTQDNKD